MRNKAEHQRVMFYYAHRKLQVYSPLIFSNWNCKFEIPFSNLFQAIEESVSY